MLSTLFDFPFEERRTLTRWSNVATVNTRAGTEIDSEEKRDAILQEMLRYFQPRLAPPVHTGFRCQPASGPDRSMLHWCATHLPSPKDLQERSCGLTT
jgi:cytochrome P450